MVGTMDVGKRMRLTEPEQYHAMVKMHLSFLLDLQTDECDCGFIIEKPEKETVDSKLKKAFTPMKKSKPKGVMDGVPLTQEGVCQVFQIIEFLGRPHNITTEGIFRKHGNLKKQQALKERLNRGIPLDLDECEFSVHECASVLKQFLANLPQPILTEAYFRAHCQVPLLVKDTMTDVEREAAVEKQIACVQLLFQLIPPVHLALLKDLLLFLQAVAAKEEENKMNSANLATMFSTHLLCPRKLSPEVLQAQHQMMANVVAFMIEQAHKLFVLPKKLLLDIETYLSKKEGIQATVKVIEKEANERGSPVVSTVFSFVDRPASLAATNGNETDKALAQLYAHVQSMPASAQKRRLVRQLNEANGRGTPDVATSGSFSTVGNGKGRQRRKSGDGLINLLTPRRKRPPVTGSYSVQGAVGRPRREAMSSSSFRRQNSQPTTPLAPPRSSLLSPSHLSCPAVLSPCRERLPSPAQVTTPNSQASEVCDIDEVDTPGRNTDTSVDGEEVDGGPPLPPRTPAPQVVKTEATPTSLSPGVRRAMATPRSRGGLMVSSGQLEKWNRLLDPAKPEQLIFEDVEGEEGISLDDEEEELEGEEEELGEEENELEEESSSEEGSASGESHCCEEPGRQKTSAYRSHTLSKEFEAYLAKHGLEPEEGLQFVDSSFEEANSSVKEEQGNELDASYSEEVRRLLKGNSDLLSTSMQVILDGGSPTSALTSSTTLTGLSGRSCGSTSTLTALCKDLLTDEGEDNSELPNNENTDPNNINDDHVDSSSKQIGKDLASSGVPRRGMKRRSLTETGEIIKPLQANQQQPTSIFFETDLEVKMMMSNNMENVAPHVIKNVSRQVHTLVQEKMEGISIEVNEDDLTDVQAVIDGPPGTPYAGGQFRIKLVLSKDFPASPPKGFFLTKIFHPNVGPTGEICVNTLKKDWTPDLGIKHILLVIKCLLVVPNPESALNEEAGKLLLEEYDEYSKRAKIYTEIHAARGPKAEVSRKRSDNSTEPNASAERDKKGKMEKLAKDKKRTLKRL